MSALGLASSTSVNSRRTRDGSACGSSNRAGLRDAGVALPPRKQIGDPQRKVVFGVITTLIDQASGLAVACAMEELAAIATIDLRVDYLRAADPGRDLFARSECYKLGHNVAFVRATAWDRDQADPFAGCLGTFMIGANSGGSPFGGLKGAERAKP
jgi:uncharacterized protein (TIGR00369 family)